ncbi:MAG: hypothetical protein ABSG59_22585 [Verrucomicrobiota bacterium]|jgi:hypothetical protein
MKFVPDAKANDAGGAPLVFQMNQVEKAFLLATLQLFPVLEDSHHHLSQDPGATGPADQRLLQQAMARQRQQYRAKLDDFFRAQRRFFTNAQEGVQLALTAEQLEWLLQILNDIRVGSWVQLGCPEIDSFRRSGLTPAQTRAVAAMDMSGYFQAALLEAVK